MHPARWTSPEPLWGRFGAVGSSAAFRSDDQARPALLRFASDEFMEQLLGILQTDPDRLGELIARPETWRDPPGTLPEPTAPKTAALPPRAVALARRRAGASGRGELTATSSTQVKPVNGVERVVPLKLYHAAHQRHYLVAANLVCGIPGFPDKGLGTGGREQVSFALRRLMNESDQQSSPVHEYAFVRDARGPHWERVPPDDAADRYARPVQGEEALPLFSLSYRDGADHPRRLLAGIIPVGRREEYLGVRKYESAQAATAVVTLDTDVAAAKGTKISARKEQLKLEVTEPWKALIRAMHKTADRIADGTPPGNAAAQLLARQKSAREANEGAQLQSWLILLDFADYLRVHVPEVFAAVTSSATNPTLAHNGRNNLLSWLKTAVMPSGYSWRISTTFAPSLRDALKQVSAPGVREGLEAAERSYVDPTVPEQTGRPAWPLFYFLLAGVGQDTTTNAFSAQGVHETPITGTDQASEDDVEVLPEATSAETAAARVDKVVQLVIAALDDDATTPAPPVPFAAQLRDAMKAAGQGPAWFVIRCSYVHYDCTGLHRTVVSASSQKFQLASFFDSDAPARPIRIALPIDSTAAGLRKHQKNTAFVLSDALCGQVNRFKGLGFIDLVLHVLPWPFHKDLDIGAKGIGPCKKGDVNFGMICSLSIPIITICALILLLMIVLVLDFIFKWIPWFIVCWPLPKFKAKDAT